MKRVRPFVVSGFRSCFRWSGIALILVAVSLFLLECDCSERTSGSFKENEVGIALEGGGALGLAHIGVLRWFEQHHIPIDYLSGNSMGGFGGRLVCNRPKSRSNPTNRQKNGLAAAAWRRNPV